MKYRLTDLPRMMSTAGGRLQVREGVAYRLFPLTSRLASIYRRTAVRGTRVVVVVGSFGKSTTARATSAALGLALHPKLLHNAFASLVAAVARIRPGQARAVIEVGIAAPGEMEQYARATKPDVVVVTSIGSEGASVLGTLENIRAEKSLMVSALAPSGTAVLNADDPNVLWMAGRTSARVVTFGFGEGCDVRGSDFGLAWPDGSRFRVDAFGETREVAVRLVGRQMAYPALAAIAVARLEGIDLDSALARLAALPPTPGRMEPAILANGVTLLRDDYKSTLETIHAALDAFAQVPARRRIVVFGDVSEPPADRAPLYAELGARVAQVADALVVVGRGLHDYSAGALRAGMAPAAIHDGGNNPQRAAAVLRGLLREGDVVLVKGRRGQALQRVQMLLQGDRVGCDLGLCDLLTGCERCPMLAAGWPERSFVLRSDVKP